MSDSSIYWGRVTHHRFAPKVHRFSYRVMMFSVFLDEVDELASALARVRLEGAVTRTAAPRRLSNRLPGNFVLRRDDFLSDYPGTLDQAARDMHRVLTGEEAPGRISMLTNLRSLGWNFNPITMFFFYDGTTLVRAICEVTNTPWNERHLYVLGPAGSTVFEKAHHVSPFLAMQGTYRLTYSQPADHFALSMTLFDRADQGLGPRRFAASMSLARRDFTKSELGRAGRTFPDMALRVSMRIYVQAAKLFAKRLKYVRHPAPASKGTDDVPAR